MSIKYFEPHRNKEWVDARILQPGGNVGTKDDMEVKADDEALLKGWSVVKPGYP